MNLTEEHVAEYLITTQLQDESQKLVQRNKDANKYTKQRNSGCQRTFSLSTNLDMLSGRLQETLEWLHPMCEVSEH